MSGELEFSSIPELLSEEEGGSVATDIVSSGDGGESAGSSEKEIRRTAEAATSPQVEREFSLNGDGSGVSGEIRLEPPAPRNRRTKNTKCISTEL